jgi:hypothetical protein
VLESALAIEDVRNVSSEEMGLPLQESFRKRIRHPPCIRYLLRYGMPSDMAYDKAHALLVRYVVTKGLNDVQGIKMAQTMTKHAVSLGGVRGARDVQKFAECLSQTRDNPKANHWSCEEIWSSKKLRERGACTGWSCEYYYPEPCGESSHQSGEAQMEKDALTYLFNNPERISEGLRRGLRSEGFVDEYRCGDGTCLPLNRVLWHVCRYLAYHDRPIRCNTILASLSRSPEMRPHVDEIERYVQRLKSHPSCRHGRFIEYLSIIEARGARLRAQKLVRQAEIALASSALPLDIVLRTLGQQLSTLSITACDKNHLFEQDLDDFMTNLFSKRCGVIPTRSEWLNASLGGGWKPGKLYVVNASSAAEATDFSAWCADFAAQRCFPTLFVSREISKDDFTERALARHCGFDREELSRYRENGFDSETDATILRRVVEAGERLSRRIARHLMVIEADSEMTVADVRSAVRTAQDRVGADNDRPILLIFDQLPFPSSDSGKPVDSVRKRVPFYENSQFERLKRQMQDPAVGIIATFSRSVTAGEAQFEKDEANTALFHNNEGGLPAADYTLTLQSKQIMVRGTTSEKKVNQLDLAREWYKMRYPRSRGDIDRLFDEAEGDHPLDEATRSYARISLFGRGERALVNPVIIYERPYHRFGTLNMEPMDLENHGALAFDTVLPGL